MKQPKPTEIEFSVPTEIISEANRLAAGDPYGYVINRGPVETKTAVYGVYQDKNDENCVIVLTRWMDGTGMFLRYPRTDLVLGENAVAWLKRYSPSSMKISV